MQEKNLITAIKEYKASQNDEQLKKIGEEGFAHFLDQEACSGNEENREALLHEVLPIYMLYETKFNKKEHYTDIVSRCEDAVLQFPQSSVIYEMLKEVFCFMSEEIYEQYDRVRRLIKEQKQRLAETAAPETAASHGCTDADFQKLMEKEETGQELAEVLFKTARGIVLEMKVTGCYTSEEEHEIYVNGVLKEKSNKMVISLFDLLPDTEYEIAVVFGNRRAKSFCVRTEAEFVTLDVKRFGAKGDGVSDDTLFLQCAINACPKNGRVYVPAGKYRITSLFLKSDFTLELAGEAVLMAEVDRTKFPVLPGRIESTDEKEEYCLGTWEGNPLDCFAGIITGINVSNVVITGQGTIDGCASEENWWKNPKERRIAWRPRLVFLNHCTNVVMHGIRLQNSPSWNVHPYFSENLKFIDLTILNPADSPNTDGLDPESCSNVEIIGVYFSLGDDCIAIKSGKIYMGAKYRKPSQNLMIRQCCMRDGHGSITIGSEMAGGVRNITVKDCKFLHTDRGLRIKTRRGRGRDAVIDGIVFENIQMDHVMTPIVINAFYFCDPDGHSEYVQSKEWYPVDERTPTLGALDFRQITATNCHAAAAYIYGLPEQKIQRVTFEDVSFSYAKEPREGVPAMMDGAGKQKKLGLFAKNVELLELIRVEILGQEGEPLITDGIGCILRK